MKRLEKLTTIALPASVIIFILAYAFLLKGKPASYSTELREKGSVLVGTFYPTKIILDQGNRRVLTRKNPMANIAAALIFPIFLLVILMGEITSAASRLLKSKLPSMRSIAVIVGLSALLYFAGDKMSMRKEILLDGKARVVQVKSGRFYQLKSETIPYSEFRGIKVTYKKASSVFSFELAFKGSAPPLRLFHVNQSKKNFVKFRKRRGDVARLRKLMARAAGL